MPFRFSGRAAEYFKIWIVNLALTIVTLGIYSAWAKVRNKRYFYRNTTVAGSAFDYHALPIQILKGRWLVVGAWILYSVCVSFFPMFSLLLLVLFYLCVPWLVVRAYVFNARNSSWRNIRFNFNSKSIGEAAKIYILFPLLAPLTLGFIGPYITFLSWRFVIDNNRLGRQPFKINLSTGRYYSAFFIAFGICLIFIVAIGSVGILILYFVNDSEGAVGFFQISFIAIIPAFLIARITYRVIVRNRSLTGPMIGAYRFNSTLHVPALCWIYFSNMIAVIFSLGLLIPWAKVRVARYVAEHLEMYGPKNVDSFLQAEQRSANVFGEEAADFFDIDLGGV